MSLSGMAQQETKQEFRAKCSECSKHTTFGAVYYVQQSETYGITSVDPGSKTIETGDKTDEDGQEFSLEWIICESCGHLYDPSDFYKMVEQQQLDSGMKLLAKAEDCVCRLYELDDRTIYLSKCLYHSVNPEGKHETPQMVESNHPRG